jgi:hypothetical protein
MKKIFSILILASMITPSLMHPHSDQKKASEADPVTRVVVSALCPALYAIALTQLMYEEAAFALSSEKKKQD